jgi:hypothetical protein
MIFRFVLQYCYSFAMKLTMLTSVYLCRYKMATTPGSVMALGSVIALLLGQLNLQGSTQYNDAISCIFTSENFCIYIQASSVFCHSTCCLAKPTTAVVYMSIMSCMCVLQFVYRLLLPCRID